MKRDLTALVSFCVGDSGCCSIVKEVVDARQHVVLCIAGHSLPGKSTCLFQAEFRPGSME